jgi:hypothetical protein
MAIGVEVTKVAELEVQWEDAVEDDAPAADRRG